MRLSRIRYVNIHIVCIMYVVMREMRLSRITYEEIHLFYIRRAMVREMRFISYMEKNCLSCIGHA